MAEEKIKVLFIAWDSPAVSYLEGLFVPIFTGLTKAYNYEFHVIQFSWADHQRQRYLCEFCAERKIRYTHAKIQLKPFAFIGKLFTLYRGTRLIEKYLQQEGIGILMPRSTMPARMALTLKKKNPSLKIIFDADGLPIEERVDFAGLKKKSFRYDQLKQIERKIVNTAESILVRSRFALEFLSEQHAVSPSKFYVVKNGRDAAFFKPSHWNNDTLRQDLGIASGGFVIVYCGSMGPQYGIEQMLYIHRKLLKESPNFYLLVLTKNSKYLLDRLEASDKNIITKSVPFESVPKFLGLADAAFAIRKSTFSMRGVAPIKLGEYLLMGLPVIASCGIGDTEFLLSKKDFAFLLKDYEREKLDVAIEWIKTIPAMKRRDQEIRAFAIEHFSLDRSVESYRNALKSTEY